MTFRTVAGLASIVLVFGCTKKEPAVSDTAADTVALPADQQGTAGSTDSQTVADSTTLPPPADASGNLTGETRKSGGSLGQDPPPRDSIIGRDSAFGPIGTMDSDGTVRPIRK